MDNMINLENEDGLVCALDQAALTLKSHLKQELPSIGIVLGSGLNALADCLENKICIPYASIPYMKTSTAQGHVGQFVCGTLAGKYIIAAQGRLHGYEGYTSQEVVFPFLLMAHIGVKTLITTNAVGAINETYKVGDFCIIADHINFTGRNPVAALSSNKLSARFFSMTDAYDAHLRTCALEVARKENISVHEGVYLGLLGPSFETPAEIRAFRAWGADTVAMSLVEEVIAARHVGMRVLGISLISNMAAGIELPTMQVCPDKSQALTQNVNSFSSTQHISSPTSEEVVEAGLKSSKTFMRLIRGILEQISIV